MDEKIYEQIDIKVLPSEITKNAFNTSTSFHLSYKDEKRIFSHIKDGNFSDMLKEVKMLSSINVGEMSTDSLKQYKYMAVSFITLAVRSAIDGGLNEDDAYAFSDSFIKKIDTFQLPKQIIAEIAKSVIKLTNSVKDAKERLKYSPNIRRSIAYINKNLDKRLTVSEVSEYCGLSADYLSLCFKKEIGEGLSEYILNRKLEAAVQLLNEGLDNMQVCYSLGFSSQSHFINVFKKKYGITPKKYSQEYSKK